MERRLPLLLALLLGAALAAPTALSYAQDTSKEDRVTGTVQLVTKDTMTILVTGEAGNAQNQVVYNADTKFTKDNKPASIDDVSTGKRVICLGKLNDKGQLVARTHRRAARQLAQQCRERRVGFVTPLANILPPTPHRRHSSDRQRQRLSIQRGL